MVPVMIPKCCDATHDSTGELVGLRGSPDLRDHRVRLFFETLTSRGSRLTLSVVEVDRFFGNN